MEGLIYIEFFKQILGKQIPEIFPSFQMGGKTRGSNLYLWLSKNLPYFS